MVGLTTFHVALEVLQEGEALYLPIGQASFSAGMPVIFPEDWWRHGFLRAGLAKRPKQSDAMDTM